MLHIVAQIEAELGTQLQEKVQQVTYPETTTEVALQHKALLAEFLIVYFQVALVVESCHVNTQSCDGQSYLQDGTGIEAVAVCLIKNFVAELHLSYLETAFHTEADLCHSGGQ